MMTDTWTWATVTQLDPPRIRLDGEITSLTVGPDVSVPIIRVGDRVRTQIYGSTLTVTGSNRADARAALDSEYARRRNSLSQPAYLMGALDIGSESVAWQVIADSTSNGNDEWVYLTSQWLAAQFPAYTINYRLWNTTNIDYEAPTRLQTGPSGERYVPYGSAGQSYEPDSATNSITGDLDIRVDVSCTSWNTGSEQVLAAKFAGSGVRSFYFTLSTAGQLQLWWTADGTTLIGKQVASGWTVPTAGTRKYLRVVLDVNNGASGNDVKFYESTDTGATWSQIGTTVTTAGTTSIFDSTTELQIGARGGSVGAGANLFGKIYHAEIRDGINGPLVAPAMPELWSNQGVSQIPVGSPVLTVVNGSHPGADIDTLGGTVSGVYDPKRVPLMTPKYGQALVTVSCSHNDGIQKGAAYLAKWTTLFTAIKTKFPYAGHMISTQNPRISPASNITSHAVRNSQLIGYAVSQRMGVLDAWAAITNSGQPIGDLVGADGIHPTPAGSIVWAGESTAVLEASRRA